MSPKTLVIGASTNPQRFSYLAIKSLVKHKVDVVAIGVKLGEVDGIPILVDKPKLNDIHTITLYLNAERQREYLDYFISLKPKRIIFNPGTENGELIKLARANGIDPIFDCTLVMLNNGSYFSKQK
ncbi:MAG: CoA-binding protein [Bacteroidales bacterium]|nr:MAG: CoA-binding protein [Bacteroidales bacterium]